MSKLFYEEMRTMPPEYVDDKTRHAYNEDYVFVLNPELPPRMYTATGGWEAFEPTFVPATTTPQPA